MDNDKLKQDERRKHPRLKLKAEITVHSFSDSKEFDAHLEDISAGGCRLKCAIPPTLMMNFTVEGMDIIVKATPVWKKYLDEEGDYQIGLEFTDISPHTKKKLMEYVNKRL